MTIKENINMGRSRSNKNKRARLMAHPNQYLENELKEVMWWTEPEDQAIVNDMADYIRTKILNVLIALELDEDIFDLDRGNFKRGIKNYKEERDRIIREYEL